MAWSQAQLGAFWWLPKLAVAGYLFALGPLHAPSLADDLRGLGLRPLRPRQPRQFLRSSAPKRRRTNARRVDRRPEPDLALSFSDLQADIAADLIR